MAGKPPTLSMPKGLSHQRRGVEQWQLVGLITRRSLVRIQPPLPISLAKKRPPKKFGGFCLFQSPSSGAQSKPPYFITATIFARSSASFKRKVFRFCLLSLRAERSNRSLPSSDCFGPGALAMTIERPSVKSQSSRPLERVCSRYSYPP